jgi:hypothetical protein
MAELINAVRCGDTAEVRRLIADGADSNELDVHDRKAPLLIASIYSRVEIATVLLEHGADVNKQAWGRFKQCTPMSIACINGNLNMGQLLSSYGAERTVNGTNLTVEDLARRSSHSALTTWLTTSHKWTTPLHHLAIIPAARAHALLRKGASIHAAAEPGDPTPLSLARELHATGEAAEGSAAALVLKAAAQWSRATHELFPDDARAYAVQMLLVGHRLSRLPKYETVAQAVFDLWVDHMMPHMVERESE